VAAVAATVAVAAEAAAVQVLLTIILPSGMGLVDGIAGRTINSMRRKRMAKGTRAWRSCLKSCFLLLVVEVAEEERAEERAARAGEEARAVLEKETARRRKHSLNLPRIEAKHPRRVFLWPPHPIFHAQCSFHAVWALEVEVEVEALGLLWAGVGVGLGLVEEEVVAAAAAGGEGRNKQMNPGRRKRRNRQRKKEVDWQGWR
jgi:hypothetical protein